MAPKLIFLQLLLIPFTLLSQTVVTNDPALIDDLVRKSDLKPLSVSLHPVARLARSKGEKPGSFSGVTYTLNPNVKVLKPSQLKIVDQKLTDDGLLNLKGISELKLSPDSIYFDPASTLIFQPVPLADEQVLLTKPTLSTVFNNIDLPRQVVPLKLANTVFVASDLSGKEPEISSSGINESYAINMKFNKNRYILKADKKDSLIVTLTGEIILTNPRIEGHYSKSNGYALIFKTSERINLEIEGKMNFGKEKEIPLWGTEIEAGDIGKCKLTLAIAIGVDGQITLLSTINQGIDLALGATGGTYYYFPTSINRVADLQQSTDVSLEMKTKMTAFAGLKVSSNLTFKGYNVLDLYIKGGMEGSVETQGSDLSADVGVRIKSGGKIVSKKFTLYDQYISLWKYQSANTSGYKMLVHEACAFGDFVAGEIIDPSGKPYKGPVEIRIRKDNAVKGTYSSNTNDKGIFFCNEIPLRYGDKVSIKIPASPSYSTEVSSTIPFKEISLLSADYYTGTATLIVAGSKSEWAQQASLDKNVTGNTGIVSNVGNLKGQKNVNTSALSQSAMIERFNQFNKNLVSYSGPINFWVKNELNQRAKREDILKANLLRSPSSISRINGLGFKPGQYVQAQIEVEGFTISSEWIQTEGLIISPLEHINLTVKNNLAAKNETYSASKSFVVVSAIDDSAPYPKGTVKLVKGFDSPHSVPVQISPIQDFPEARRAVLWFNREVDLVPLTNNPGVSIASTEPWSVSINYANTDYVLPAKNGKHFFEKVSYIYNDKELGYSVYTNQCHSCSTPQNLINLVSKNKEFREAIINQDVKPQEPAGAPKLRTVGTGKPVR